MTDSPSTIFAEVLDALRSAAFVQGEAAAKGDGRKYDRARKLADRTHEMVIALHAHEVEREKGAPPLVFGGDGTMTFAALVDRLIEASSYANMAHVIDPNNESGPRELAAARQAVLVAFGEANERESMRKRHEECVAGIFP